MRYYFASIFFMLSALVGPNPMPSIISFINEDMEYLIAFYKHRHQNPEISLMEENTAKELAEEIKKLGFEVTENFGGHGIVGILKNGDGPLILYRTDMDALPMPEKQGFLMPVKKR